MPFGNTEQGSVRIGLLESSERYPHAGPPRSCHPGALGWAMWELKAAGLVEFVRSDFQSGRVW